MSTDLDLVGLRYNTAAAIFFVRFSFFAFLDLHHDKCCLRFCTVSRKSHRELKQYILNSMLEITFAQKYHPQAIPTFQMEYDDDPSSP